MFTLILLPTFMQNALADDPIVLPPITVTAQPNNWVLVCIGPDCRLILGLSSALAAVADEIGEGGGGAGPISMVGFQSKDQSLTCQSNETVRQGNAGSTIAGADIFWEINTLVLIRYSNGQSEIFRLDTKFGTLRYVAIPGSCG